MVKVGIEGKESCVVNAANTAAAMGSGDLPVFSTPSMIALMEAAASRSLLPFLEEDETSVGISMQISHSSATPVGMKVYAESRLEEVDGRRLVFSVTAWDEAGQIGEGRHERFLVKREKFIQKSEAKKGHSYG